MSCALSTQPGVGSGTQDLISTSCHSALAAGLSHSPSDFEHNRVLSTSGSQDIFVSCSEHALRERFISSLAAVIDLAG